jgi:hypothetical protein
MMAHDLELDGWRADWQTAGAETLAGPSAELRRQVRRRTVRMAWRLAGDLLVGALWILAAAALAVTRPHPAILVLCGGVALVVIVATGFSIWNSAGAWRPRGESVAAFVELAGERCRRDLRAIAFAKALLVVQLVFVCSWVFANRGRPDLLPEMRLLPRAVLVLPVLVPIGTYLWIAIWQRRTHRALARLDDLRAELRLEQRPDDPA